MKGNGRCVCAWGLMLSLLSFSSHRVGHIPGSWSLCPRLPFSRGAVVNGLWLLRRNNFQFQIELSAFHPPKISYFHLRFCQNRVYFFLDFLNKTLLWWITWDWLLSYNKVIFMFWMIANLLGFPEGVSVGGTTCKNSVKLIMIFEDSTCAHWKISKMVSWGWWW